MSYSSEDETDISDSELDEYVDRCYGRLRDEEDKVKFSDVLFRCPYCPGKKKLVYPYKDLLQHASDVAKGSQNRDIKHKGKHLGLVKYIKNNLGNEDLSTEFTGLTLQVPPNYGVNELFVWPWMGILATADVDKNNGHYIGSSSKLKNDLAKRGFDPVRVRHLADCRYAVVEFKKDWSGFYNAIMFEKEFEVDHHGKKDLSASVLDDKMYGWVAREDDYNSKGILAEHLQKNGDLKTITDLETEEKRRTGLLITNLNETIEELRMQLDELKRNNSGCSDNTHVAS